jgi:hypothetical protein
MLDGIEVEFPAVDRGQTNFPEFAAYTDAWKGLVEQLRPSPHMFTNL